MLTDNLRKPVNLEYTYNTVYWRAPPSSLRRARRPDPWISAPIPPPPGAICTSAGSETPPAPKMRPATGRRHECQRTAGPPGGRTPVLPADGSRNPGGRTADLAMRLRRGHDPLARDGLGQAVRTAFGENKVGVVEQPVDGSGGRCLGHDRVEPPRIQVRRDATGPLVGGVDHPVERLGRVLAAGSCRCRRRRMSSLRQMRASTRLTEASTLARPMVAVSDSRVNHETRTPVSMTAWAKASTKWLLPVPLGPLRARFSGRPAHSGVRTARLGWPGMEESSGRQLSKVLPVGKPTALRRIPLGRRPGR